jgi:hypothetical protein
MMTADFSSLDKTSHILLITSVFASGESVTKKSHHMAIADRGRSCGMLRECMKGTKVRESREGWRQNIYQVQQTRHMQCESAFKYSNTFIIMERHIGHVLFCDVLVLHGLIALSTDQR